MCDNVPDYFVNFFSDLCHRDHHKTFVRLAWYLRNMSHQPFPRFPPTTVVFSCPRCGVSENGANDWYDLNEQLCGPCVAHFCSLEWASTCRETGYERLPFAALTCEPGGFVRRPSWSRSCNPISEREKRAFLSDILFERRSEFLDQWEEWRDVVNEYYSANVRYLWQTFESKRTSALEALKEFELEGLVCAKAWDGGPWDSDLEDCSVEYDSEGKFVRFVPAEEALRNYARFVRLRCRHCNEGRVSDVAPRPTELYPCDAGLEEWHLKCHVLNVLSLWKKRNPRFAHKYRRYYSRLSRVILAMPLSRLQFIDWDVVFVPTKYNRSSNLLRSVYSGGAFDGVRIQNIVDWIESMKHVRSVVQQSGASLSRSDALYEEMLSLAADLTPDKVDSYFKRRKAVQQGFGVPSTFEHKVHDETMDRLQDLVTKAQTDFFEGLKGFVINTTAFFASLFVVSAVVTLMLRLAQGALSATVVRLVNFIIRLVAGENQEFVSAQDAAVEATVVQQAGVDAAVGPDPVKSPWSIPSFARFMAVAVLGVPKAVCDALCSKGLNCAAVWLTRLGDSRFYGGIGAVIFFVRKVILGIRRWVGQHVFGVDVGEDLHDGSRVVDKWCDKVEELVVQHRTGTFIWSDAQYSVVCTLYHEGLAITRQRLYQPQHAVVWKMLNLIGNILEGFKKHNSGAVTARNPPVTIYVCGDTGVGKSALSYPLSAYIIREIFKREGNTSIDVKKEWQNLIYTRAPEQEYWDGYKNQLVCLFDDFNQQVDTASNPAIELFEVIRASNCFPYPLHMADLERKETTDFTSKVIICSTNMEVPRVESLNFPNALKRRFDVVVRVKANPNFKRDPARFDPRAYEFELCEFTGTNLEVLSSKGPVGFRGLVDKCVDSYCQRQGFVASMKEYIDTIFDCDEEEDLGAIQPFPSDSEDEGSVVQQGWFSSDEPASSGEPSKHAVMSAYDGQHVIAQASDMSEQVVYDSLTGELAACRAICVERSTVMEELAKEHPWWFGAGLALTMTVAALGVIRMFYEVRSALGCGTEKVNAGVAVEKSGSGKPDPSPTQEAKAWVPLTALRHKVVVEQFPPKEGTDLGPKPGPSGEAYPKQAPAKAVVSGPGTVVQAKPVSEGLSDRNAAELLLKVVRKNLVKMYYGSDNRPIGHALFLRGRLCLMPKHFLGDLRQRVLLHPEETVQFKNVFLDNMVTVGVTDLLADVRSYESPEDDPSAPPASRDLCVVRVRGATHHASAVEWFPSRGALDGVQSVSLAMPLLGEAVSPKERDVVWVRRTEGRTALAVKPELAVSGEEGGPSLRKIRDAWEYVLETVPSDCGAPVIVSNTQISPGKIIGVHVAGQDGTGRGWATPIYCEDAMKMVELFPEEVGRAYQQSGTPAPQESFPPPLNSRGFIPLGVIPVPVVHPAETKIVPSLCHGELCEPKTRPCALGPVEFEGKRFCPRTYRLERLLGPQTPVSVVAVDAAVAAYLDDVSSLVVAHRNVLPPSVKARYTFDEAVCGIPGDPYVNSVKRSTSPGYPFVQDAEFSTRKRIFGSGEEYDLTTPQALFLRARVAEIIQRARVGESLDHVFIDTLKDERKPVHKAHKSRLFSAGPLDYLIACKMYFNGPVAVLQWLRNDSHVSVGTNVYSHDWKHITTVLHRKSRCVVAGDFEGFDAGQTQLLLEGAGEVLIELSRRFCGATGEDIRVMRTLLVALYNSCHVSGRHLYQWTHSLPSGHYLTAVVNSIYVNLVFSLCWARCWNPEVRLSAEVYGWCRQFYDVCGIVAYGDDHLVAVPEWALSDFSQRTVPRLMAQLGLSYTMEDKDRVVDVDSRPIEECSYLKRGFRTDPVTGEVHAPLNLDTVLETPMWIRKCPDPVFQMCSQLEWTLKELSLHEREVFEEWAPKICGILERYGVYTPLKHYELAQRACKSQSYDL